MEFWWAVTINNNEHLLLQLIFLLPRDTGKDRIKTIKKTVSLTIIQCSRQGHSQSDNGNSREKLRRWCL